VGTGRLLELYQALLEIECSARVLLTREYRHLDHYPISADKFHLIAIPHRQQQWIPVWSPQQRQKRVQDQAQTAHLTHHSAA